MLQPIHPARRAVSASGFRFSHYGVSDWVVENVILIPHFAFPLSAIDFQCPKCAATYQLKAQSCAFSRRIVDAAYSTIAGVFTADESSTEELQFGQYRFADAHASVAIRARWALLV